MKRVKELKTSDLRKVCKPSSLGFRTTSELALPEFSGIINQERAREAILRGTELPSHILAVGPSDVGRETLVRKILSQVSQTRPTPCDTNYVYDFENPLMPRVLTLPAGQGRKFAEAMKNFSADLFTLIAKAVDQEGITALYRDSLGRVAVLKEGLKKDFEGGGFTLAETPQGLSIEPKDKKIPPELKQKLLAFLEESAKIEQELGETERSLILEFLKGSLAMYLSPLRQAYGPSVEEFLTGVEKSVLQNYPVFLGEGERDVSLLLRQYEVNLLVDHSSTQGAPVEFVAHPTYENLVGVVEYVPGPNPDTLTTDHTLIRPGALQRANGGFLVLNLSHLLNQPAGELVYETLKRTLRFKELSLDSPSREFGASLPLKRLKPQPLPLDVKVILIGEPDLFGFLKGIDSDFAELFRVWAEFETKMERTPENEKAYASFIRVRQAQTGILPFEAEAVARVIEYGSRLVESQKKLSLRFGILDELIQEASKIASLSGSKTVTAEDVRQALRDQKKRISYREELDREEIRERIVIIETAGKKVGQINGLSVSSFDEIFYFGSPVRITARTFAGREGVIDILRESEFGGPMHTQGILTLVGYLGGKYAQKVPFSLSAHITFEETHGRVDGPSASMGEALALISSLAEIPLRQNLSITGYISQRGEAQAVGGVNEKIEGWYGTCQARRLTGKQGVIIPAVNVRNLMLSEEVVEAVRKRKFHIYPVRNVDQALLLLAELKPQGLRGVGKAVTRKLSSYAQILEGLEGSNRKNRRNNHRNNRNKRG